MPNESRFSRLPHRIILPVQPVRRRPTRALLVLSFAIAVVLVAVATLISHCITKGN
jgi:hypothetical protein